MSRCSSILVCWYSAQAENMCQTPITTGWHIKATNRCPIDSPVRHKDFSQLAFPVGKSTTYIWQAEEEEQLGSLPFFQPPSSAFSQTVPVGHATGHSHPRAAWDWLVSIGFFYPQQLKLRLQKGNSLGTCWYHWLAQLPACLPFRNRALF